MGLHSDLLTKPGVFLSRVCIIAALAMFGAGCGGGRSLVGEADRPVPRTDSPFTNVPDPLLEENRVVASVPPNLMPRDATESSITAALRDHLNSVGRSHANREVVAVLYLRSALPVSEFKDLLQRYRLHGGPLANLGVTFRKHIPVGVRVPTWSEYLRNPSMGQGPVPSMVDAGVRVKSFPAGTSAVEACDSVVAAVLRDPGPVDPPYQVDASSMRIASARIYGTLGDLLRLQLELPSIRAVGVIGLTQRADSFVPYWRPYRAGEPLR